MITGVLSHSEEDVCDALCEDVLSPAFMQAIQEHYASRRVAIPFRAIEAAYTDDVDIPDGYPAFEFIAVTIAKDPNSSQTRLEISAQISVNGDKLEEMARELKRLAYVTRKWFDGRLLAPICGSSPIAVGNTDYGPSSTASARGNTTNPRAFVKTCAISLFFDSVV